MKTSLLETVRRIAQGHSPVEPFDIVQVGEVCREAEAAGYIRTYHGCFPDWGGYKVTEAGHKLLAASV